MLHCPHRSSPGSTTTTRATSGFPPAKVAPPSPCRLKVKFLLSQGREFHVKLARLYVHYRKPSRVWRCQMDSRVVYLHLRNGGAVQLPASSLASDVLILQLWHYALEDNRFLWVLRLEPQDKVQVRLTDPGWRVSA